MDYYGVCRGDAFHPGGYALTKHGVSLCGFHAGARICDIGCGTGSNIDKLKNDFSLNVTGVEPSPQMRGARPGIIPADAQDTTLPDEAVDGVLCECVWSLCDDPDQALAEMHRILKKGGKLILSDVYSRGEAAAGQGPVKNFYPIRQVERFLLKAGFEILVLEDHTKELITLMAQMIMDGKAEDCKTLCRFSGEKSGYFLIIAAKR